MSYDDTVQALARLREREVGPDEDLETWEREREVKTYRVVEHRMYQTEYLVNAENETAAGLLDGEVLESYDTDSWAYELISVEEERDGEED